MIFRVILFALATAAVIGGLAYWLKCLCLCDYENACDYSEVQQILKGENVVPVPSVDEVADLSASDVPRILDGFFVIKPRKDGNNEYLRQL